VSDAPRLALLRRALDQAGGLIAEITPAQRSLPTPCEDWDVAALVGHVVGGLDNFTASARGEQPDWSAPRPRLDDDWQAAFRTRADALLESWRAADPARLDQASMQITEQAVHAWDIARAIGRPTAALDDEVAEHALAWGRQMLKPEYRGTGAFGAEVEVPAEAPAPDRLAAWFGRDPRR
jgi:uncharacterized protein (TIGR03086 family)